MGLPAGSVLAVQTVAYIEPDPAQSGYFEPDPKSDGFPKITKVQIPRRVPRIPGLEEDQPVERIGDRELQLVGQDEHGLAPGVTVQDIPRYGVPDHVRAGH